MNSHVLECIHILISRPWGCCTCIVSLSFFRMRMEIFQRNAADSSNPSLDRSVKTECIPILSDTTPLLECAEINIEWDSRG